MVKNKQNKLEAEIKKFGKETTKKEVRNLKTEKLESMDINAYLFRKNNAAPVAFSDASSHSFTSSLVSHWNPHLTKSFQQPSNISSMVTHCTILPSPSPGSSLLLMAEVIEALDKAAEELIESRSVGAARQL